MIGTRKCGVAVMGTARARYVLDDVCMCVRVCVCAVIMETNIVFIFLFRVKWPPKELSKSSLHNKRYNMLYYMNDPKENFRMFRWIDNNIVKMVFNVHMGTKDEVIMKARKKTRINEFKRKHIRLVWGDDHVVSIKIPTLINDYNMWMLGVDLVDQLIAYY